MPCVGLVKSRKTLYTKILLEGDNNMSWRDYEFEIPLGVELPDEPVSEREDWWDDCEEDDVFDLEPKLFYNKNEYDAALELCRICAGWFYFRDDGNKNLRLDFLRKILGTQKDKSINYFNVAMGSFEWIEALRDNNEKYSGKLFSTDSIWQLFQNLGERSLKEKADCFKWFVQFFGDNLQYDTRKELTNCFVNGFGNELELMLLIEPDLANLLTEQCSKVSDDMLPALAGRIRRIIALWKGRCLVSV